MAGKPRFGGIAAYGPEFDQPEFSGDGKNYIICYAPRSGSWLLCDLLRASGVMGVPAEYFNMDYGAPELAKRLGATETDAIPFQEYLEALKKHRTTPNGVFGFKVEPGQMDPLIKSGAMATHFPGLKFVFLTRRDVVAQGVSYEIAKQTRQWVVSPTRREAVFDEAKIRNSIDFITRLVAAWEKFFSDNNMEPYRVDYETLIVEPHRICSEICDLVGVDTDHQFAIEESGLERQANTLNDDWIRRIKSASSR